MVEPLEKIAQNSLTREHVLGYLDRVRTMMIQRYPLNAQNISDYEACLRIGKKMGIELLPYQLAIAHYFNPV